ncbi:MAG TPA: hypothetical protein VF800_21755 [Telluria sp.]|jgi:hypothetical protein
MERYERHFVSQRIGRAIGAVEFDGNGKGVVEITAPGRPASILFSFTLSGGPDRHAPTPALAEVLLRTAIAQAHRDMVKPPPGGAGPSRRLSNVCAPWIGDLELMPYGGATSGYAARAEREP